MKIWTCSVFEGHWPVGTAAVVRAASAEQAAHLLMVKLKSVGLEQRITGNMMVLFSENEDVRILCDGDC